jgi:hypothetical protein
MPKLGARRLNAFGRLYTCSVSGTRGCWKRGPLPKENFCLAEEKLVTSCYVIKPPCLLLRIVDIIIN